VYGPVFLRAAYLQDSGFSLEKPDRFRERANEKFGPNVACLGDVVITTKGNSTGRIGLIRKAEEGAIFSPHLSYWRSLNPKVLDQSYLYYWSLSYEFRSQLYGLAYGTDMAPYLSLRDQGTLKISIPPIGQQQAIGSVLSGLDDKIELNRQTNETLEALARALFKDWFVDFGPTRTKAEGGAPYLAPELWALFPDALDDEDKPVGWEKKELGDLVSLTKGRSYRSSELRDSATALVTLKSFQRGGGYRRDGLKPFDGSYKPEQVITPGELVVALTDVTQAADVIGKPAIISHDYAFETLVASLDVGILRSKNEIVGLPYLYCLLRTEEFQNHIYGHCSGTTVLHLGKHGIPSYELRMPSASLLSRFDDFANPLWLFGIPVEYNIANFQPVRATKRSRLARTTSHCGKPSSHYSTCPRRGSKRPLKTATDTFK